jgi:hypothetical protein
MTSIAMSDKEICLENERFIFRSECSLDCGLWVVAPCRFLLVYQLLQEFDASIFMFIPEDGCSMFLGRKFYLVNLGERSHLTDLDASGEVTV